MALPDLTGQFIENTYQRLLQKTGSNEISDGTGSIFIPKNAISASYAVSASHEIIKEISSSYADTASYALTALSASYAPGGGSPFPFTGDAQITGSLLVSGSGVSGSFSGSFEGDGSNLTNLPMGVSASYALTASYVETAQTASYVNSSSIDGITNYIRVDQTSSMTVLSASFASTASYVLNAISSSYAHTASYINPLIQDVEITGSLDISGSILSSGTISGSNLSGTNTGDVTLAGTPDYITISGQIITRNTIDIGDDTNLAVDDTVGQTGIDMNLSGDTLSGIVSGLTTTSDVLFNNITSSNNISASGDIFGVTGSFSYILGSSPLTIKSDYFNVDRLGNMKLTGSFNHSGSTVQIGDYELTGSFNHSGNVIQVGDYTQTGDNTQTGDFELTGSFNHTGSAVQIGDNTQIGDYELTGSFNHSGSTDHSGSTVQIGDFELTGSLKLNGSLELSGGLQFGSSYASATLTGNTDDLLITDLANSVLVRLDADNNYSLTGIVVPDNTKTYFFSIFNVGTNKNITFKDDDTDSIAQNRFLLGANVVVQPGEGITLIYDPVSVRWRSPGKNI